MNSRHLLQVACFCLAAPVCACGVAGVDDAAMSSQATQIQALAAEQAEENEEDPGHADLPAGTEAKVRSRYGDLKASGALDDRNWRINTAPPEQRYTEIVLQDDFANGGVTDGYYTTALIPLDDAQGVHRFFVNRIGGVSGWQFLAGPFQIEELAAKGFSAPVSGSTAVTVVTEQNAGQTVRVEQGATVVAELPSNPSTGYAWTVAAAEGLGAPVQQYVADQPQASGSGGMDRFTWSSVGQGAQSGQTYSVRFVYKRAWESASARDFTIQFQVK